MNKILLNLLKGNTFLFLVSFINSIILARLYSSEEIGIIRTLTLYGSVIIVIGTFQLHVSLLKFLTNFKKEKFRIIQSVKFVLLTSSIITIIYFLIVVLFFNESISYIFYIIYGLILIPLIFFNMLQNFYIVLNKSKRIVRVLLVYGIMIILLTFGVGYFNLDLKLYFSGLFIVFVIMFFPWFKDIVKLKDIFQKKNDFNKIDDQIKYSTPLIFSNVLYLFMSRFDKLWMSFLYPISIVGNYFVVAFENPLNGIVIGSSMNEITHSMSVLLEENKKEELMKKWTNSIFFITSILFLPSFILFENSKEFISFLFGDKYVSQDLIFKIYCFIPLVRTASYQSLLRVYGYTRFHLVNSILSFIATLCLGTILSIYFSYLIFPISYLFGYLIYNLGVVIYISKKEKLNFFEVYGILIILKQALVVILTYVIYKYFAIDELNFYVSNLVLIGLYLMFYFLIFYKKIKKYISEKYF